MMSKYIRSEEDLQKLMEDVRNRQHEDNTMLIDVSNIFHKESYEWNKEYLELIEHNGMETVYVKQYVNDDNRKYK